MTPTRTSRLWLCGLTALGTAMPACAPVSDSARVPPAPIVFRWPDPAFLPERQCRGTYAVEALERYLPRARLALWLPSTRAVTLDPKHRCINVTVESVGAGRLAELVLRGAAVPRRAILLRLERVRAPRAARRASARGTA